MSTGVRIALLRGGIVTGHVFDEHRPIAGVDLRPDAVQHDREQQRQRDDRRDGPLPDRGAPAGPITLRVHKDGFRMKLVSGLRVDSGATLRQDVTLVTLDGGAGFELGGIGGRSWSRPGGGITCRTACSRGDPARSRGTALPAATAASMRIDGEGTQGMSMADVLQRLRGEPGTSVGVSAQRPDTGETVDLTIVRGTIVH